MLILSERTRIYLKGQFTPDSAKKCQKSENMTILIDFLGYPRGNENLNGSGGARISRSIGFTPPQGGVRGGTPPVDSKYIVYVQKFAVI
jgi:hypothetical protein